MSFENVKETLVKKGWHCEHDDLHGYYFWKHFPTKNPCQANSHKGRIPLDIQWWNIKGTDYYSLEIVGLTTYGDWIRVESYSLKEQELLKTMDETVPRLIRAWETLNKKEKQDGN